MRPVLDLLRRLCTRSPRRCRQVVPFLQLAPGPKLDQGRVPDVLLGVLLVDLEKSPPKLGLGFLGLGRVVSGLGFWSFLLLSFYFERK